MHLIDQRDEGVQGTPELYGCTGRKRACHDDDRINRRVTMKKKKYMSIVKEEHILELEIFHGGI